MSNRLPLTSSMTAAQLALLALTAHLEHGWPVAVFDVAAEADDGRKFVAHFKIEMEQVDDFDGMLAGVNP